MDKALRKPSAKLADLALVHFRTESHMTDAIRQWKNDIPVMVAESCARQVWLGVNGDFAEFPFPAGNTNAVKCLRGSEAYKFLLHLITGNDSAKAGESNIAGQFNAGWAAYERDHPYHAARLNTLMQFIRADTGAIRSNVTNFIRPPRHEMAARYLSGQKRGEQALVIGHVTGEHGLRPSLLATALLKALGNNRKGRVSRITVTHPKRASAITLYEALENLKAGNFLHSDVFTACVPFNTVAREFETHQLVFTDLPMNECPDIDAQLISLWKNRKTPGNRFVHMRGEPKKMGNSSSLWAGAGLMDYIAPEDIRAEMTRLGGENRRLKALAGEAVAFFTALRAACDTPNWHKFQKTKGGPAAAPA